MLKLKNKVGVVKVLMLYLPLVFLASNIFFSIFFYFVERGSFFSIDFNISKIFFFFSLPLYVYCLSKIMRDYSYYLLFRNLKNNVFGKSKIIVLLLFSQFGIFVIIVSPWVADHPKVDLSNVSYLAVPVLYLFYFFPTYLYLSLIAGLQSKY